MNINATVIAQGITFFFFIWATKRFVWPILTQAMNERQRKIADGLAAAERGVRDLENAKKEVQDVLNQAKEQAADILNQANRRSGEMIDEAKRTAREEGERQLIAAKAQIQQEVARAREELRKEVAKIAVLGASRILAKEIDAASHKDLLDKVANEL